MDGWPAAAVVVVGSQQGSSRAHLFYAVLFAAIAGWWVWIGVARPHTSTPGRVFAVVFAVLLLAPMLLYLRRLVTGRWAYRTRYYRFGWGWVASGRGEPPAAAETYARTDEARRFVVTTNTLGRYSVTLTDTSGRTVRLAADDVRQPECWKTIHDGLRQSIEAGTLDISSPRMRRRLAWLAKRAAGAHMPAGYGPGSP